MGSVVDVELRFAKEKHARWAAHVVESLVKLCYAPLDGLEIDPKAMSDSMSDLCLQFYEELRSCDPVLLPRDNALTRMRRDRTRIVLERCSDVQWMTSPRANDPDDFFTQLCFSLVRRFPQVRFVAYTRYEMTVSGAIQRMRASWNGERLQVRQISGERPLDENSWDTWEVWNWSLVDGRLKRCDDTSTALQRHYFALLSDAREAAAAGDAYAALRFADDAAALPHCSDRLDAYVCRAEVGRSLRRRGVRRFVQLASRDVPQDVEGMSRFALMEMPLDVGTHVLRNVEGRVQDVDVANGEVHAETLFLGARKLYLVGGQYLFDDTDPIIKKWRLIDWEYEV